MKLTFLQIHVNETLTIELVSYMTKFRYLFIIYLNFPINKTREDYLFKRNITDSSIFM